MGALGVVGASVRSGGVRTGLGRSLLIGMTRVYPIQGSPCFVCVWPCFGYWAECGRAYSWDGSGQRRFCMGLCGAVVSCGGSALPPTHMV